MRISNHIHIRIHISKEKFEDHMELLLISENENKHFVYIKDFNRFMLNQTKHKNKNIFVCIVCNVLAQKMCLMFIEKIVFQ